MRGALVLSEKCMKKSERLKTFFRIFELTFSFTA